MKPLLVNIVIIFSLFRIQNQLGVNALFTWGVVPENKTNYIAIVPGGWVEELLMVGHFCSNR